MVTGGQGRQRITVFNQDLVPFHQGGCRVRLQMLLQLFRTFNGQNNTPGAFGRGCPAAEAGVQAEKYVNAYFAKL